MTKNRRKQIKKITFQAILGCCCILFFTSCSSYNNCTDTALSSWNAGSIVSLEDVYKYGEDNCFKSIMIDDSIFNRMKGKSYKDDCTMPRDSLRYLKVLHYDFNGNITLGEIVCNVIISNKLLDIFKTLYKNKYPIEKIKLIDDYDASDDLSMADNNSSAFNFRFVAGTTKLSNHSKGLAIDINTL